MPLKDRRNVPIRTARAHDLPLADRVPPDVRRPRVVAGMALIAVLAAAAVPGSVGSQGPSPARPIDASLFRAVDAASIDGTAATTPILDPAYRSDGSLDHATILLDADERPVPAARPDGERIQPAAPVGSIAIPQWHL